MTLSRPKQREGQNVNQKRDTNFTCFGEYCTLINTLDQQRDVIHTEEDIKYNQCTSRDVENSRNRASLVLKRLLLKSELANLEESGKMIHLRISQPICTRVKRHVPKESILMSQKEHRLAFLELTQAEDDSFQVIDDVGQKLHLNGSAASLSRKLTRNRESTSNGLDFVHSQANLETCEMCFHVYRLLSHTRCLLSSSYRSTPLGRLEDMVFNLNKIVDKSMNIPQKKPLTKLKTCKMSPLRSPSKAQAPCTKTRKVNVAIDCDKLSKDKNSDDRSALPLKNRQNISERRTESPKNKRIKYANTINVDEYNDKNQKVVGSISQENRNKIDESIQTFHYDEKTTLPYLILGNQAPHKEAQNTRDPQRGLYNLVVCHDLFDTLEKMKIFFSPFLEQYPCHQILLWNYPGQAYTTFSTKKCLNNEFHAKCLDGLLKHVGIEGINQFDHRKQFFFLGHGYGGSVVCQHASKCQYIPGLRGIYLINPLTYVDVHFASVMHDCRNVFSCTPETRPDLPLYFYSRFIFSKEYLNMVSTPLALNLYTAIHNPITVNGRISLCDGVLNNIDLRESLKLIKAPIITVHGKNAELIRPIHAAAFLEGRNQRSTIHGALKEPEKSMSVLIMTEGGHELFQEKKKTMLTMIVELLLGYHDINNVQLGGKGQSNHFQLPRTWGTVIQQSLDREEKVNVNVPNANYDKQPSIRITETHKREKIEETRNTKDIESGVDILLDPANPCFERHQNDVYKTGTGAIYNSSNKDVKPREYMSWRLKRNRKRLSRFQKAARVIQGALRVYMAKTMIVRLRRQRSALNIQRCYRGLIGRRIFNQKRKELWAAKLVQRVYRGALGRRTSYYRRISIEAQKNIARVWRGYVARKYVNEIKRKRNIAAIHFQCLWRRCMAIDHAQYLRIRKQSCTTIQRLFRGHKGRQKAERERDKYVFSKSQSMGIELGRQMLAEHKLHATRLQSELSLLDKERTSIESKVESISRELDRFQVNTKKLEKSMHEISAVEAQKRFDVATQHAIRQKKVQLDEDFSTLLSKISDRKNQLKVLEEKLSLLNRNKREKKENLQKLERKLVALLEAQENELNEIKRRQNEKVDQIARSGAFPPSRSADMQHYSERDAILAKEKKKTAKLMNSTETMMKFGFMSMAMTYFTSMNMVGAMKNASITEMEDIGETNLSLQSMNGQNNGLFVPNVSSTNYDLTKWNVENVTKWLSSIYLSQYVDSFRDASIDGPFLCQLTDEDLKDALGIEHKLHRKKILLAVEQLKSKNQSSIIPTEEVVTNVVQKPPEYSKKENIPRPMNRGDDVSNVDDVLAQAMEETKRTTPTIDQLSRWVRNQKIVKIKESLQDMPAKDFDQKDIRVQFVEGVGTSYMKSIEDQVFHINKCDEHGNTLMHVAAQNGNMKIAMFLINKGANPNHQNKQGQTPGHFALSYQFYDFASWLFDPDGGKGNDLLTNIYGLGPYDGLSDD